MCFPSIPVYGLYPDTLNEVTLRQLSENGETIAENVVKIQTEPLPEWLDNYVIRTESYEGGYEAGLNYMPSPLLPNYINTTHEALQLVEKVASSGFRLN